MDNQAKYICKWCNKANIIDDCKKKTYNNGTQIIICLQCGKEHFINEIHNVTLNTKQLELLANTIKIQSNLIMESIGKVPLIKSLEKRKSEYLELQRILDIINKVKEI